MRNSFRRSNQYRRTFQVIVLAPDAVAACSVSILAIDRPLAEFVKRNAKPACFFQFRRSPRSAFVPFVLVLVLVHRYVISTEAQAQVMLASLLLRVVEARGKTCSCRAGWRSHATRPLATF